MTTTHPTPTAITVLPGSHTDHAMSAAQRAYALEVASTRVKPGELSITTVTLPEELGTVPCDLYGPLMGDPPVGEEEVRWACRGSRPHPSRLVDRPSRQVRTVVVVAGPVKGTPMALFTMYGGLPAPREPGDKSLESASENEREESRAFWAVHALAAPTTS